MKTIIILFLTILLFSASCKSNVSVEKKNVFALVKTKMDLKNISYACKVYLQKDLRKMWMFNEKGNCYYESEKIRNSLLDNQQCFFGISKIQLVSILGAPNKVSNSRRSNAKNVVYYLGSECKPIFAYWTMQFLFNENDQLIRIGMDQISLN